MLFLFQISLQIKMAMLGGWKKNETPNQRVWLLVVLWRAAHGKIKPEDVNWQKVGYAVGSLLLVLFDLVTDVEWKIVPGFEFIKIVKIVALSFFYNNVVSEWGLAMGFLLTVDGFTSSVKYGLFNWLSGNKSTQNTKPQN